MDNLKYGVKRIEAEANDFLFEAVITCAKCSKQSLVKTMLTNILKTLKIEIGPKGIIVKSENISL